MWCHGAHLRDKFNWPLEDHTACKCNMLLSIPALRNMCNYCNYLILQRKAFNLDFSYTLAHSHVMPLRAHISFRVNYFIKHLFIYIRFNYALLIPNNTSSV